MGPALLRAFEIALGVDVKEKDSDNERARVVKEKVMVAVNHGREATQKVKRTKIEAST